MDICIYTCICGLRVHADMFAWAVSVSDSHMSLGCSSTYLYDTYICMPAQFCWRKCNVSLATCINVYVHAYLCTCFPVNAHRYQTKILCVSFHLGGRSFAAFSGTIGMAREGFPQKKASQHPFLVSESRYPRANVLSNLDRCPLKKGSHVM